MSKRKRTSCWCICTLGGIILTFLLAIGGSYLWLWGWTWKSIPEFHESWTQEELASRLGLTKSVVSAYETGLRYPSYDILIRIASIFKVSTDHLLGVEKARSLDISGLSPENELLVRQLVAALSDRQTRAD